MTAGITPTEAANRPRGATIRTSRREDVKRFLEWHGFHAAEIRGPLVTYRRDNLSGGLAALKPSAPPVIPIH